MTVEQAYKMWAEKPELAKRWGINFSESKKKLEPRSIGCCPDCGAPLAYEEGCNKCYSCGYYAC